MKILIHMCCGPCSVYPFDRLKENHEITGLFYNPNIHPYKEYQKRMDTALQFSELSGFKMIVIDEYNLDEFLRNAAYRETQRCLFCYSERLERTASIAKKNNYDAFTTSLLVSPYQNHDLIKKIGQEISSKYSIEFYYEDFRLGYKEGVEKSKHMELYRQPYCGCIYSERDRYAPKKKGKNNE